ncbi:MAG: polyprenyl diphosphate synthase [Patescibacteria group bacterium]
MTDVKHLGIIMDGNRRWARSRGMPALFGHQEGYANLKKIIRHVFDRGVEVLTLFAFSTENWNRPQTEVNHLLSLFTLAFSKDIDALAQQGLQIRFIGDLSAFPKPLRDAMDASIESTKNNARGILNIAVNYGGRDEIVRSIQRIVKSGIASEDITEDVVSRFTYTADLPSPDLIIRTSGEYRLSGFLTWQSVYSELYFTPKSWPEFSEHDLDAALEEYQNRQRRFGS